MAWHSFEDLDFIIPTIRFTFHPRLIINWRQTGRRIRRRRNVSVNSIGRFNNKRIRDLKLSVSSSYRFITKLSVSSSFSFIPTLTVRVRISRLNR